MLEEAKRGLFSVVEFEIIIANVTNLDNWCSYYCYPPQKLCFFYFYFIFIFIFIFQINFNSMLSPQITSAIDIFNSKSTSLEERLVGLLLLTKLVDSKNKSDASLVFQKLDSSYFKVLLTSSNKDLSLLALQVLSSFSFFPDIASSNNSFPCFVSLVALHYISFPHLVLEILENLSANPLAKQAFLNYCLLDFTKLFTTNQDQDLESILLRMLTYESIDLQLITDESICSVMDYINIQLIDSKMSLKFKLVSIVIALLHLFIQDRKNKTQSPPKWSENLKQTIALIYKSKLSPSQTQLMISLSLALSRVFSFSWLFNSSDFKSSVFQFHIFSAETRVLLDDEKPNVAMLSQCLELTNEIINFLSSGTEIPIDLMIGYQKNLNESIFSIIAYLNESIMNFKLNKDIEFIHDINIFLSLRVCCNWFIESTLSIKQTRILVELISLSFKHSLFNINSFDYVLPCLIELSSISETLEIVKEFGILENIIDGIENNCDVALITILLNVAIIKTNFIKNDVWNNACDKLIVYKGGILSIASLSTLICILIQKNIIDNTHIGFVFDFIVKVDVQDWKNVEEMWMLCVGILTTCGIKSGEFKAKLMDVDGFNNEADEALKGLIESL